MANKIEFNVATKTTVISSYELLEGELEQQKDSIRSTKIEEFRLSCKQEIENGFDSDIYEEGVMQHYSLTIPDQSNLQRALQAANAVGTTKYKWDGYVGETPIWTLEKIQTLVLLAEEHIWNAREKYATLKQYVLDATDMLELQQVSW